MSNQDINPFQTPTAAVDDVADGENTSGLGKGHPIPEGIKGWCWGGFLLNWIWSIGNKTWIGLLALIPYVGLIMMIVLGVKGREWAWQNKRWDSVDHFQQVQRRWSIWGTCLLVVPFVIGILAAIAIPMFAKH